MRTRALLTSKTQPNVLTLSRGSVAKHCTTCSLHQGAHHGARGAQQGKWPTPSSYSIPRAATQQESSPGLSDQPARPRDARAATQLALRPPQPCARAATQQESSPGLSDQPARPQDARAATQRESSPGLSDQPARPQDALLRLRTTSAADARLSITSQPRNPPSAARAPHASARDSPGGEDQLMACSRGALPRDTLM